MSGRCVGWAFSTAAVFLCSGCVTPWFAKPAVDARLDFASNRFVIQTGSGTNSTDWGGVLLVGTGALGSNAVDVLCERLMRYGNPEVVTQGVTILRSLAKCSPEALNIEGAMMRGRAGMGNIPTPEEVAACAAARSTPAPTFFGLVPADTERLLKWSRDRGNVLGMETADPKGIDDVVEQVRVLTDAAYKDSGGGAKASGTRDGWEGITRSEGFVVRAPHGRKYILWFNMVHHRCICEHGYAMRLYDDRGKWLWQDTTNIYGVCDVLVRDINGDGFDEVIVRRDSHFSGRYTFLLYVQGNDLKSRMLDEVSPPGNKWQRIERTGSGVPESVEQEISERVGSIGPSFWKRDRVTEARWKCGDEIRIFYDWTDRKDGKRHIRCFLRRDPESDRWTITSLRVVDGISCVTQE